MKERYTDREIVEMIRSGEHWAETRAVRYLLARNEDKILAYVMKNSGTREDGEEILHDSIVIVCGNIRSGTYELRPGVLLSTYLYQVGVNRWLKKLRGQQPFRSLDENSGEANAQDLSSGTIEDALIALENQSIFERIWEMLTNREQGILLDVANHTSYHDVARKYGLKNADNAKAHKYLISKKLKNLLKKYGGIF